MSHGRETGTLTEGTNISPQESAELDRLLTECGKHPVSCTCRACYERAFNPARMHSIEVDEDSLAVRCAIIGLLAVCALTGIVMGIAAYNGWL